MGRGQSWGVYGIALSYRYLKNPEYIDLFCRVTDYFLEHLPEDLVPYWDFDFDTGSTEPRDSSASAVAICGYPGNVQISAGGEGSCLPGGCRKIDACID